MEAVKEFLRNSPFAVYAVTALAALSYIILSIFSQRRRHSPPLPPGPRGMPLLGYLPFLHPDLHIQFTRLAASHGPVFRLQLGASLTVVVSSAAAAREIFRDQDTTFANHYLPAVGRVITYDSSDIVWTPYGPLWRMLRKMCTQDLLAGKSLECLRCREVRAMVRRVAQRATAGEELDVGKEAFLTVIGILSGMLWGESEGSMIVDGEFKSLINEIMELMAQPNVSDFFPWLRRFDIQRIEKKMWILRKRFDQIFERSIAARKGDSYTSEAGGFLDVMLRMEEKGSGDGKTPFTRNNTKGVLLDIIGGGTDTTSNTVEFAMAEMMNRPEIICKAQAELDDQIGRDTVVEQYDSRKLPYLSAVIKETLRLHTPGPLLPRCPSADCVVGGYTVPAGTRVFVNTWAIHRDPTMWDDPFTFKPERFVCEDGARWDFSGSDIAFIPFGSGRRICIGNAMAERTLTYVLATLLHAFDWQLPNGVREINIEERFGLSVKMMKPLLLKPKLRLSIPDLYQ